MAGEHDDDRPDDDLRGKSLESWIRTGPNAIPQPHRPRDLPTSGASRLPKKLRRRRMLCGWFLTACLVAVAIFVFYMSR